jgi:N utilization substance protein A
MSREILLIVDALAREKNVPNDIVFDAVEQAIAMATRKKYADQRMDVCVTIDRQTGKYQAFRRYLIVDDLQYNDPDMQMTPEELEEKSLPVIPVGEYYEIPMDGVEFGRISAQMAKQVILQKIRDAEKDQLLNEFLQRREKIVYGTVKRFDRAGFLIECGRIEAFLPKDQTIGREILRNGDRVRAYLSQVDRLAKGPSVILSRIHPMFLTALFEMQVPEIEDGLIEIKAVARDPGLRAKIAVKSNDPRIDAQGTCIGMRGSRVNAVTDELAGERIDVIAWSPDPARFVINALSPAEVSRILIDEDSHSMDVVVDQEHLAAAIGRNGQNVRLASELTGWVLNIMTVEEAQEKHEAEDAALKSLFICSLDINDAVASVLVQEGFTTLEEIAYVPVQEMLEIKDFDQDLVQELRTRARDAILTQAIASEERVETHADELRSMEGMTDDLFNTLSQNDIHTRDDLADLAVIELVEMAQLDESTASALILKARENWFNQ